MRRELASAILDVTHEISAGFSKLDPLLRSIEDEDERKAFLRGAAEIMATIATKIQMPIIREHAELDPDE